MCGRYAASRDKAALIEEFEVERSTERELPADYNVAPTKDVYIVADRAPADEDKPTRELAIARWGLVPSWAKDPAIGSRMINARAETLTQKPSYRRAVSRRRCLVPADGYYEWYSPTEPDAPVGKSGKPRKQPYYIHRADGGVLAMAGLYEFWRNPELPEDDPTAWLRTTTIITTAATDEMGRIHDRMPLMVPAAAWHDWLNPDITDGGEAVAALGEVPLGWLRSDAVSTAVNSVRNNGPELTEPIPAE